MENFRLTNRIKRGRYYFYRANDGKIYTQKKLAERAGMSVSSLNDKMARLGWNNPKSIIKSVRKAPHNKILECANPTCNNTFFSKYASENKKFCCLGCRDEVRYRTQTSEEWLSLGDYDQRCIDELVRYNPTSYEERL